MSMTKKSKGSLTGRKDEKRDEKKDEKKGRQELLEEQIRANVKKGYSKEMIADFLGVDLKTIEAVIAGLVEVKG